MWNERYQVDEYIYGTEPNTFLKENVKLLSGPVFSIAEGEGRNAVYLATQGMNVLGVDGSEVALAKAQKLAEIYGVEINTVLADLSTFEPKPDFFQSVISISAHLPSEIRKVLYPRIERCLKRNGIILLEAYSEKQLQRSSGGPKDIDMLMTEEKIRQEFPKFEIVLLHETEREVNEGSYHTGLASVVQYIGRKI